ncbi:UDP-glycosyltransferase UGT5-like [Topomyia yanbarensis]|uniref:UDP-glycosyltransferase UGT5-like n=1 Tax=Topomyia yanbarensis TaxID=2498891 RepID=UPI00273B30FF|nr:UDP-glycosyltransferase UGT5-like [Topomyia yanbarensis]
MALAHIVLGVALLAAFGECAKILGVIPTGGRSHHFVGASYMKILAEAGHDVTVISAFPEKNPPQNYRNIELTGVVEAMFDSMGSPFQFKDAFPLITLFMIYTIFGKFTSEYTLNHPNVQQLLHSGETFDVVIVETFMTEAIYGMAQHFNASLITYSPFGSSLWTAELTGTPTPTSYIPSFAMSYDDKMTFWERFWNTVIYWWDNVLYRSYYLPKQKQVYEKAFPNASISLERQMKSVSLVLLNDHFTLGSPRPNAPNMVEVGGVQIEKVKPLPKDLQKFLDEATDGAIYFSMGSYLKSAELPVEKRDAFIRAFSRLKQRVIWKFEDESIPNQPSNLLIKPWMPQNDILAHPNVKLFITHGGLLGTTEALYHGKPIVGIPIFGDQMMNVRRAVRTGYGVMLDLNDATEESVLNAIETVLNGSSYSETARAISRRYHDKPATAKETALYWIEYVIRHQGAQHLRSPAVDLSVVEYHLFDVYQTIAVLICVIVFINYQLIRFVYLRARRPRPNANKKIN